MQKNALIRVFDVFDQAELARSALLDAGFDTDAVVLTNRADEAGPVEGNFAVGNTPVESDDHVYDRNYQPAERGHCLLMIAATDAAQSERASVILAQFGGRDPDPFAP